MSQLYIPNKKIAIASSFEGVVNNGAKECAFVSLNAYQKLVDQRKTPGAGFFGREITPDEFRNSDSVRNSNIVRFFLKMRPVVAVAEDYHTVLMVGMLYDHVVNDLVGDKSKEFFNKDAAVEFFCNEFKRTKAQTQKERGYFKVEFDAERKLQQEKDYKSWLALQKPYMDTLEQLRILNGLKKEAGDKNYTGFVLYYVTSKDEASTYQLCTVYGEFNLFKNGEIGGISFDREKDWPKFFESLQTCIITQDRIIGTGRVAGADKVGQMKLAAEQEGVPHSQIFRLNDRYDPDEVVQLKAAGFEHNFVVTGGYAFSQDYENARTAGIPVIEKSKLAETLSAYAREKGF